MWWTWMIVWGPLLTNIQLFDFLILYALFIFGRFIIIFSSITFLTVVFAWWKTMAIVIITFIFPIILTLFLICLLLLFFFFCSWILLNTFSFDKLTLKFGFFIDDGLVVKAKILSQYIVYLGLFLLFFLYFIILLLLFLRRRWAISTTYVFILLFMKFWLLYAFLLWNAGMVFK